MFNKKFRKLNVLILSFYFDFSKNYKIENMLFKILLYVFNVIKNFKKFF